MGQRGISGLPVKVIMGHQKALIIWAVALGLLASTLLTGTCLCGEACAQSLRAHSGANMNSLIHMQCSGGSCKSCELERFQTVKEVNSIQQTLFGKCFGYVFIADTPLNDSLQYNHLHKSRLFWTVGAVSSSPVYLLNLSFLC